MTSRRIGLRQALPLALALIGAAGATSAQAGGVSWSIGINVPAPPMVVYQPQPVMVYQQPPVVMYQPAPVVTYVPRPVVRVAPIGYWQPSRRDGWYDNGHRHHHHHDRWEGEREARWEGGHRRDRY